MSAVEWAKFLSPSKLAPIAVMLGVIIMLTGKRRSSKEIASIIVGFGLLFIGITTMSSAVSPLQESESFCNIFVTLGDNPLLGILAGTVVTADGGNAGGGDHGGDPEFVRVCRYSAEPCGGRSGPVQRRSLYHHGSEYRYLCDGDPVKSWGEEECQDGCFDASAVQYHRNRDFQYYGDHIL